MREITEREGKSLINSHQAGWYAIYANPPIVHDKQMVVNINERWFLLQVPQEIEIKLVAAFPTSGMKGKGVFSVELKNEELIGMLKPRLEKLERGPEILPHIPVYLGGNVDNPDLRN